MTIRNPGVLLTLLTILTPVALVWALYSHWWTAAALFAPIALCHICLLFQIRPAAYVLLAAYVIGCIFIVASFFIGTSLHLSWWRLALRLCLNLGVIHELWQWLCRPTALE